MEYNDLDTGNKLYGFSVQDLNENTKAVKELRIAHEKRTKLYWVFAVLAIVWSIIIIYFIGYIIHNRVIGNIVNACI